MNRIDSIDGVEIYFVRLPLVKPFETSFSVETHKEALLLKLTSGVWYGWGECVTSPHPFYSSETNETAYHIIKDFLVPIIIGMKGFNVEDILLAFKRIRGHNMAKATMENAILDLQSRSGGIPLYNLIGGSYKKIQSGISIGIKEDVDELLESIQIAIGKKYHRVKIKIKKGKDLEVLRAVRETFPKIDVMADANADYTIDDLGILKQFDAFNLMMIEQPLTYDDIYHHSLLQKEINTPICLDESVKNLEDAKTAISLKSCRIINIKQGRVGGLLNSKAIQSHCKKKGIKVWSGGMLETGIGRAFNLHLQTLPGFVLPGDTSETSRYFNEDIVDKVVTLDRNGFINIPDGNGIGVEVVESQLNRFKTFYEKIKFG